MSLSSLSNSDEVVRVFNSHLSPYFHILFVLFLVLQSTYLILSSNVILQLFVGYFRLPFNIVLNIFIQQGRVTTCATFSFLSISLNFWFLNQHHSVVGFLSVFTVRKVTFDFFLMKLLPLLSCMESDLYLVVGLTSTIPHYTNTVHMKKCCS